MKTVITITVTLAALSFNAPAFQAKPSAAQPPDMILPLVVMDEVPLADAMKNLFRQMGDRNYIVDPRMAESLGLTGGSPAKQPIVSGKWTNITAEHVLADILARQKLKLVENSSTTVTRVVSVEDAAKPVEFNFLTNKGSVMPSIFMTDVALGEAITNLARQALMLPITLDPALEAAGSGPGGKALSQSPVTFTWRKISAKQGLAAVLENYGLILAPGEKGAPTTIIKAPPAK